MSALHPGVTVFDEVWIFINSNIVNSTKEKYHDKKHR